MDPHEAYLTAKDSLFSRHMEVMGSRNASGIEEEAMKQKSSGKQSYPSAIISAAGAYAVEGNKVKFVSLIRKAADAYEESVKENKDHSENFKKQAEAAKAMSEGPDMVYDLFRRDLVEELNSVATFHESQMRYIPNVDEESASGIFISMQKKDRKEYADKIIEYIEKNNPVVARAISTLKETAGSRTLESIARESQNISNRLKEKIAQASSDEARTTAAILYKILETQGKLDKLKK